MARTRHLSWQPSYLYAHPIREPCIGGRACTRHHDKSNPSISTPYCTGDVTMGDGVEAPSQGRCAGTARRMYAQPLSPLNGALSTHPFSCRPAYSSANPWSLTRAPSSVQQASREKLMDFTSQLSAHAASRYDFTPCVEQCNQFSYFGP
jgi:hypothetical protein